MNMLSLVRHDTRLQYRYGIYAAYAFVVGFYVLMLLLGRQYFPGWVVAFIIYSDPAAVGFFFLGALMMLEKSENVRGALAVSPATASAYLAGKTITLCGLALAAALIVLLVHGAAPNPVLLLLAVGLTSVSFLAIGIPIALRFDTVNGYLIGSAAFLTPLIAPAFLALLSPFPSWLLLWPPTAQFRLMLVALGYATASDMEIAAMLAISLIAAGAAIWFAHRVLLRELAK